MPRILLRGVLPLAIALTLSCEGEPRDFLSGPGGLFPPEGSSTRLAFRLGDTGADQINDVAVDAAGAVYVTGIYSGSVDFDQSSGVAVLTSLGGFDIFVAKYSSTNQLVWARSLGGPGPDSVSALALDASGDVVISGWFEGTPDFDPGPASSTLTSQGGRDGFVARLSTAGAFQWARRFGGPNTDALTDVTLSSGVVFATGSFEGQGDGSPGGSGPIAAPGLGPDIIVVSFEGNGTSRGAFALGGVGDDRATGITADGSAFFLSGSFDDGIDFDPGPGDVSVLPAGLRDGFLAAYAPNGGLLWARMVGGTGTVEPALNGLSFGGGSIQLVGTFTAEVDLDPGPGTQSAQSQGQEDVFVIRVSPAGATVTAFTVGSPASEAALRAAADATGLVVAGRFSDALDLDPGNGTSTVTPIAGAGAVETFVVRYASAGQVAWSRRFGPTVSAEGTVPLGLALGPSGTVVFGGAFTGSMDVDPGTNAFVLTSLGGLDGFVVRLTSSGGLATAP